MTRSVAEQTLLKILRNISNMDYMFSWLINGKQLHNNIRKEFNDLNTLSYSQSFLGSLRILTNNEFLDFFYFILDSALAMGSNEVFPLYRSEIIFDETTNGNSQEIIFLHFYKSIEKLYVTKINNETNSIVTNEYNEYNASNTPTRDRAPRERFTTPRNGELAKNYYPQPFPNGVWEIKEKINGRDDFEGPLVLRTDAFQYVNIYEPRKEGNAVLWKICGRQQDGGYNIHAGGASWKSKTLGCIRVEESTIRELASWYDDARRLHYKMCLSVDN
jgi:hypothetical protein